MRQFVPNFVSYVSAKYYLNCLTVWKVVVKVQRVNFLLRHSVHVYPAEQSRSLTLYVMFAVCLVM